MVDGLAFVWREEEACWDGDGVGDWVGGWNGAEHVGVAGYEDFEGTVAGGLDGSGGGGEEG